MAYHKLAAIEEGWVVFGLGCAAPSVVHDTLEGACAEACRLAGLDPERKFFTARLETEATGHWKFVVEEKAAQPPVVKKPSKAVIPCGCPDCLGNPQSVEKGSFPMTFAGGDLLTPEEEDYPDWGECEASCGGCELCF